MDTIDPHTQQCGDCTHVRDDHDPDTLRCEVDGCECPEFDENG